MKTPLVNSGCQSGRTFPTSHELHEKQYQKNSNFAKSSALKKNVPVYYRSMVDLNFNNKSLNANDRSPKKSNATTIKTAGHNFSIGANQKDRDVINKRNKISARGDGLFGTGAIPAWKLKKALRAFKMVKLNEVELEFGSPHVQYFLASLCDHVTTIQQESVAPSVSGIRARCPLVAEVRLVVSKLKSSEPVNAQGYQLSVAVAVLKEFLNGIPGGVFNDLANEFYEISLHSKLDITIIYLNSIIHELPYIVQQFTYLLCKALRNLVRMTGGQSVQNYTDLLMHFTPVLYPTTLGDVDRFLRAARLLLVMVDHCERVFLPLPWLDGEGNWCWHNDDFEEESFIRSILNSLQNLEATLACDDSGVESEVDETSTPKSDHSDDAASLNDAPLRSSNLIHAVSLPDLYRFAYLELDDSEDQ